MQVKQKTTAEIMREAFVRRGARPLIIDGHPVQTAKGRKAVKPGGNGSKK